MGFKRAAIYDGGLQRNARAGDGSFWAPTVNIFATDAIYTVTVDDLAKSLLQVTGLTAGRIFTTPTAALIAAAFPEMDVGVTLHFAVSVVPAFAVTWAAGAGVTLAGKATTPASGFTHIMIVKTGAATFTWYVL